MVAVGRNEFKPTELAKGVSGTTLRTVRLGWADLSTGMPPPP